VEGIQLHVAEDSISSGLEELGRRGQDMQPVFETIGDAILSNIEENFRQEGRYSDAGIPGSWRGGDNHWTGLAKSTVKKRGTEHPILQQTGALASSFVKEASAGGVIVGTNKEYAAIHNFGGKTGRGHKVTMPSRPILTIADETIAEINEEIGDFLTKSKGAT
jgi:phage virion morphogenesis protein